MVTRRQFLNGGLAAGAGLVVLPRLGWSKSFVATAQTPRAGSSVPQFVDPLPSLEIVPLREEKLCLVSPAGAKLPARVGWRELSRLPLVMPQRGHIFRKLMESSAALAGVQLDVQWEVSSVPPVPSPE